MKNPTFDEDEIDAFYDLWKRYLKKRTFSGSIDKDDPDFMSINDRESLIEALFDYIYSEEEEMPKIQIIPEAKKPAPMTSAQLSTEVPRCKNTGKPPLPLDKSYSPVGKR